jgi:hypothetical protein
MVSVRDDAKQLRVTRSAFDVLAAPQRLLAQVGNERKMVSAEALVLHRCRPAAETFACDGFASRMLSHVRSVARPTAPPRVRVRARKEIREWLAVLLSLISSRICRTRSASV